MYLGLSSSICLFRRYKGAIASFENGQKSVRRNASQDIQRAFNALITSTKSAAETIRLCRHNVRRLMTRQTRCPFPARSLTYDTAESKRESRLDQRFSLTWLGESRSGTERGINRIERSSQLPSYFLDAETRETLQVAAWWHHRLPESSSACSMASSAVFSQQGSLPGIGMDGSFTYVKKVFREACCRHGRDADVIVASARVRLAIRLRAAMLRLPTANGHDRHVVSLFRARTDTTDSAAIAPGKRPWCTRGISHRSPPPARSL